MTVERCAIKDREYERYTAKSGERRYFVRVDDGFGSWRELPRSAWKAMTKIDEAIPVTGKTTRPKDPRP